MLHWIRLWIDWLRNERLPLARIRRNGTYAIIRHEAVGGARDEVPIPWAADLVIVEVALRLPPPARRKSDFSLCFPHGDPITADAIRPDSRNRHRVSFRFPTPQASIEGEVQWKRQTVTRINLPILTAEEFLNGLVLSGTSVSIRHASGIVPISAFVPENDVSLIATTEISSPHSLTSLSSLGLSVCFRNERTGKSWEVMVPLTAEQRNSKTAIVSAACPRRPRWSGPWSATWRAGNRDLVVRRMEAITARRLEEAVRVADARFVVTEKGGSVRIVRQVPTATSVERLGPCFFVSSAEAGSAGICPLSIFATPSGEGEAVHLVTQNVLITDAPTAFAPHLYAIAELVRAGGFELRLHKRILGTISLSPVPPAALTSEGGFKPPPNFTWTVAAEEELLDRLGRLGHANA